MSPGANDPAMTGAHLEAILDTIGDGIYLTDRDGVTILVNAAYEKLTGLNRGDLVGVNVRELKDKGVFNIVLNPEIVESGKPVSRVQTNMHGRRVVLSGQPILGPEGEVALVVTHARDITIMSQMKDQIVEQRETIEKYHKNFDYMNRSRVQKTPLICASPAMSRVAEQLQRIAPTDATVLILGETGVGKDVAARKLHERSGRHDRPFFKIDCSAIPENLIESELFGYVPGAFSGASSKGKIGFFEIADKGTVFLDEIGDLPLAMQSRLLRVLQDLEVVRVGSTQPRKVDVRIIAATNRDLAEEVKRGSFRSDLYYRLRVAVLQLPPLRERREDILPLARHFLEYNATRYRKRIALSPLVEAALTSYRWPGNIREMENLMQSLAITCESDLAEIWDLPASMAEEPEGKAPALSRLSPEDMAGNRPLKEIMADMEREVIRAALARHKSVGKVARLFGVNRTTIFRKLNPASPASPKKS